MVQSDAHPDFSTLLGLPNEGNHATHVAGTIAAAGIDPAVRGIAPQARVKAYDSFGDLFEMMAESVTGEMLFSNHSYGPLRGWEKAEAGGLPRWHGDASINADEDVYFGLYDIAASALDAFSVLNADFLSVWSAGNDRNIVFTGTHEVLVNGTWTRSSVLRGRDGGTSGFDTIAGHALAKNVLTVGAVDDVLNYTGPSSVRISSFSSAGPADDGRIKPDVVANGVDLISTTATEPKGNSSGTSMAAPGATGALVLLSEQEEIENHTSSPPGPFGYGPEHFRQAATYKALLIHTADECGAAPGPDYMFGWGLINVETAARVIRDDSRNNSIRIRETAVLPLTTWSMDVESTGFANGATGTMPAKVTVVWTDLARLPLITSLDPTDKALVHDLDVRVERLASDGSRVLETFFPWRLSRANPSAAATKGDNDVDNVEQIEFNAARGSRFHITVRHKGVILPLGQAFSLVTSGLRETPGLLDLTNQRGACCKLDGSCTFTSGPLCLTQFGVLLGTTSTCVPNPCPQPVLGACCSLLGCFVVLDGTCIGEYKGRDTTCSPNPCRPGACCTLLACQIVREGQCPQGWKGSGSTCSPSPCVGACCGLLGCSLLPKEACEALFATFKGNGTTCTPTRCSSSNLAAAPGSADDADQAAEESLSAEDGPGEEPAGIAGFQPTLERYLAGDMRADVNGDGVLNEADLAAIVQRLVTPAE